MVHCVATIHKIVNTVLKFPLYVENIDKVAKFSPNLVTQVANTGKTKIGKSHLGTGQWLWFIWFRGLNPIIGLFYFMPTLW